MTHNAVRRDYRGITDLPDIIHFCQRIWTVDNRWHLGDLAWDIGLDPDVSSDWRIAIWERAGDIVGLGWLSFPDRLSLVIGPDDADLLDDIVTWADDLAGISVTVTVLDTETWLTDPLEDRGHTLDLDGHFFLAMHRTLDDLPPIPEVPVGYTVRPVRDGEISARAGLHRSIWSSSMSDDTYDAMRRRWPYELRFDWVVQAPDGALVSYILGWYDAVNRVGEFEPVGTLEAFRRQGLSNAVGIALLHAFRDAGGERAIVYARGDDDYPIPRLAYGSLGFRARGRTVKYQPKR